METGKGDRWEGDRQGRSEPPFRVPAPPYSLHQPALHGERPADDVCWLLFCCEACTGRIVCSCASRPVPGRSSAGCVHLQRPCSTGFACLPPLPCHAHCPPQRSCPVHFALPTPLFISMCARIVASCTDCPVGSYNTGLQWRPVRRF